MAVSAPTLLATYASTAAVTTSGAVAVGAAVPAGSVILVAVDGAASGTTFGVSDSKGNTWTQVCTDANATTNPATAALFVCVVTSALTTADTITVTRSTSNSLTWVAESFTGVDTTTPVSSSATANAAGVAASSCSTAALTAAAGDLVYGAFQLVNSVTGVTAGAGFTLDQNLSSTVTNPRRLATEYQQVASGGSVTPSLSWTTAGTWVALGAVLKAAAAAPAVTAAFAGTGAFSAALAVPGAAAGLPTVSVKLDDGTGTFPYDISAYVRLRDGISIQRGRADEFSGVSPSTCSLVLENTDGRFTLRSATYNIAVDQRIRVAWVLGGVTYKRFTGYVQDWPVAWPDGGDTYATAAVTAVDRQSRTARRRLLATIQHEYLALSPWAVYALGEPSGATTFGDTSVNHRVPLALAGAGAAPNVGTSGLGPDGLASVQFTGGQYLTGTGSLAASDAGTIVVHWTATAPPAATATLAAFGRTSIQVLATGVAQAIGNVTMSGGPNVCDGAAHQLAVVNTGTRTKLYVDGALVADSGVGSGINLPATFIKVGQNAVGTIWMVGIWTTYLTDPQLAQLALAGVRGFATDRADQRIARLAGYANIPAAEQNLETGQLTSVAPQATAGVTVQDAMQAVADAEGGVVLIDGDGRLVLQGKGHRPAAANGSPAVALTTDQVDPGVVVAGAKNYLINTATGGRAGGATQRSVNDASVSSYEEYPADRSAALLPTDALALDLLTWLTSIYSTPQPRLPALPLDLLTLPTPTVASVLAANLGDLVRVTGWPAQTPASLGDLLVEGWSETLTEATWDITLNTVPAQLFRAPIYDTASATVDTGLPVYF